MVFGKAPDMTKQLDNIIMGFVGIVILFALLPTIVDTLVDGSASLFNGTVFETIFVNGLVWYGFLIVGLLAYGRKYLQG
jgi:hypothetical protein